jgi:hypothetical protein
MRAPMCVFCPIALAVPFEFPSSKTLFGLPHTLRYWIQLVLDSPPHRCVDSAATHADTLRIPHQPPLPQDGAVGKTSLLIRHVSGRVREW